MKPKIGDIFTSYHEMMGCYIACQITKEEADGYIACLYLDWTGTEPLRADQLKDLKPLYIDYMGWDNRLCLNNVDPLDMPLHYVLVGNVPPISEESTTFTTDWEAAHETSVMYEFRWRSIPEEQRKVYKAAKSSDKEVSFAGKKVPLRMWRVADDTTPFGDMKDLRVLPCLSALILHQWHSGLLEYLRENPFIHELGFYVPECRQLDLRGSHLNKCDIDLADMEELWLNDDIDKMTLSNAETSRCHIHARKDGAYISLFFYKSFRIYPELSDLHKLTIFEVAEVDMQSVVAVYPNLRRLFVSGKPGYIRNFSAVSHLRHLEELEIKDMFGFTAEDIPEPEKMEKLKVLFMDSVPEDTAKAAKKLYGKLAKEGLVNLQIYRPRKAEWLAQNLNNPFRHWDGEEYIPAASAKKAVNQYKKTRKTLMKLTGEQPQDMAEQALAVVKEYVRTFNKMRCIGTAEREEIYTALCDILASLSEGVLDSEALIERFEEMRDF